MYFKRILCMVFLFYQSIELINGACNATECPKTYFMDPDLGLFPDQECYAEGATVTYVCSGTFGGPPSNQCNSGGTWQFPAPSCDVVTCIPPAVETNIILDPDKTLYDGTDVVTYSCSAGYELTGPASATCDTMDTWNPPTLPVCTPVCNDPTITNGELNQPGPYNDGDAVLVYCDPGYSLPSGASSIMNCNSGSWDQIPQCYLDCNITGVSDSDSTAPTTLIHEDELTIYCLSGFSFEQETVITVGCDDGTVIGTVPSMCFADCAPLLAPGNGSVSGGNLHGEIMIYSCDRGFGLNGTDSATCNDGDWDPSDNPPLCYGKSLEDSIVLYCNSARFIVEIPGSLFANPELESISIGGLCNGTTFDGEYLYANSSYNECGTILEVDNPNGKVIYRNTVTHNDNGTITFYEKLTVNIECKFEQTNLLSSSAIGQNVLIKDLNTDGQYDISFGAFFDNGYTNDITEMDSVETGDSVYLRAIINDVTGLDVYPYRCFATPFTARNGTSFGLVENGCSQSIYARGLTQGNSELRFDSTAFRFTSTGSTSIYFHCDLKICPSGSCPLPACGGGRRRRSINNMHMTSTKHVFVGPIRMRQSRDTEDGKISIVADKVPVVVWQMTALTIYGAIVSALLVFTIALLGVTYYRRRSDKPPLVDKI